MLEWRLKAYRHWVKLERRRPSRSGPTSTTRRSTTRTSSTTRRPSRRRSAQEPRRSRSRSCCETFEKLGISAGGAEAAQRASRSTRSSTASRWRPRSRRSSRELGIIFCSFSEAVQKHPELVQKYLGSVVPVHRQLLRGAERRRLHRRLVLLHPEGRALPDGAVDLLPHQRRRHRPVRAHADRRRGGQLRELPGGLHRAHARQEPAARGGRGAGRARRRRDQVLDGAELVPGRQGRQGRHLQLRHQARQVPRARTPRSRGPRSRPARRSPGSTRAASCRATTRSASSTRSR